MKRKRKIVRSFQKWLLLVIFVAFLITTIFSWISSTKLAENHAFNILSINLSDVHNDINDASDENLLSIAHAIAEDLNQIDVITSDLLNLEAEKYDVTEINYIDKNGIVCATTYPDFLNFDMSSGEQSREFMVLLNEKTEFVQPYGSVSYDVSISRKYGGVRLKNGGFVQIGYNADRFHKDIDNAIVDVTHNRHVGEGGYIIVVDENWNIVSDINGDEGKNLYVTGVWIDKNTMQPNVEFTSDVYGERCYCMYNETEGYLILAVMPIRDVMISRNISVALISSIELFVLISLFIMIFLLVNKLIVKNIYKINKSLSEITDGNLEVSINVRSHEEFEKLSDSINLTVDALKKYIADAESKIDKELMLANIIQHTSIPSIFPPYPNIQEFDMWATMHAAEKIGGDFYDFYLLNNDILAFLIADVSGKGIPAALVMMEAKTLLRGYSESGISIEEVLSRVNEKLCKNNDIGMFVTMWMGFLDINTGKITYINAGHNPPLLKHVDGTFTYLKSNTNFVLAGMENTCYLKNELKLEKGDILYLYTDGVTEATNLNNQLYGTDRLIEILNKNAESNTETICAEVKKDIDLFVGQAPQFDDITMLALKFNGLEANNLKELSVAATVENIRTVIDFVNEQLEAFDCPTKAKIQIDIAIDEIFGNIAQYAYNTEIGEATVRVEIIKKPFSVIITFIDNGVPYNPLKKDDPDTTLSANDREIGGLGIYVVKKSMDTVNYEYKDGQNILTIKKFLN